LETLYIKDLSLQSLFTLDSSAENKQVKPQKQASAYKQAMLKEKQRGIISSLRKQIEYYFGDKNYPRDQFMHDNADSDGYISLDLMLTFNRIKALTKETQKLIEAVANSKVAELSECKTKIRRKQGE
jgi:hypothetical protein